MCNTYIVNNPGPPHEYVSVRPSNLIDLNLNKKNKINISLID